MNNNFGKSRTAGQPNGSVYSAQEARDEMRVSFSVGREQKLKEHQRAMFLIVCPSEDMLELTPPFEL